MISYESKLSKAKIAELKETFDLFDKDGNGQITTQELHKVLEALGQHATEAELQDMINEVDADGDGMIEFPEYLALMERLMSTEPDRDVDEVKAAFKVFDQNDDGFISTSELSTVMKQLGTNLNAEEIDRMLRDADKDKDGKIDFEEFLAMMTDSKQVVTAILAKNDEKASGAKKDACDAKKEAGSLKKETDSVKNEITCPLKQSDSCSYKSACQRK